MNLTKLKVGTRLGAGFFIVLFFLVAVTIVGIYNMKLIQDRLDHVVSVNNVVNRLVIDMRNNVAERITSLRVLTLLSEPDDMAPEMKRVNELAQSYEAAQKKLTEKFDTEASTTAQEKDLLKQAKLHESAAMPAIAKASELSKTRPRC
jgi:methyl-accepting chemotaxis protein